MAESGTTHEVAEFEFDGARVVRAQGEFSLDTAADLRAPVQAALESGSPVVLDLAGVRFMDSTGLSVVLNALKDSWGRGHALLIAGPLQPPVESLLAITGVDRYLTVHPSWNAAIDALVR